MWDWFHKGKLPNSCQHGMQWNPCNNWSTCYTSTKTLHTCRCRTGFTRASCQTVVNTACNVNPCNNGGICKTSGTPSNTCTCTADFTRTNCQIGIFDILSYILSVHIYCFVTAFFLLFSCWCNTLCRPFQSLYQFYVTFFCILMWCNKYVMMWNTYNNNWFTTICCFETLLLFSCQHGM